MIDVGKGTTAAGTAERFFLLAVVSFGPGLLLAFQTRVPVLLTFQPLPIITGKGTGEVIVADGGMLMHLLIGGKARRNGRTVGNDGTAEGKQADAEGKGEGAGFHPRGQSSSAFWIHRPAPAWRWRESYHFPGGVSTTDGGLISETCR